MFRLSKSIKIKEGHPRPLGLTKKSNGMNFAIFSEHATKVVICFFKQNHDKPSLEIPLKSQTGNIWHILIENLPENLEYAYKLDGPKDKTKGYLFYPDRFVSDPLAKQLNWSNEWSDKKKYPPRGKIQMEKPFDWEGVVKPNHPMQNLIIYEMHVRGFTKDKSSDVEHKGTFLAMIDKIPYLKKLGINAVELLPVFEFDECSNPRINPKTNTKLYNYWGYSPINFFALMNRYSATIEGLTTAEQFKMLVKELHRNNIEVILDVVYNHTAEGGDKSHLINFRGIENSVYYLLDKDGNYLNYSGCGNTFSCNHIVTREHILDSLKYWVSEMQVDGFRFDLASILTRDPEGKPMEFPPLIEAISLDPIFSDTKLIAEAWDCAGLYQVGSFPSWGKWMEWNGKFRDSVRMFIKGDVFKQGDFATYFLGSQNLYGNERSPYHSVNFITCHDGFSMHDLVSYNQKHNEENGEDNKDGINENHSWNCGEEGTTQDGKIKHLREKQLKNFFFVLLCAQGTPMISMGDEYGHTKRGNNNTWCQDSDINWFQWDQLLKNKGLFRFVRSLIEFRKNHSVLGKKEFVEAENVEWHSTEPLKATWDNPNGLLALTLKSTDDDYLYFAFNPTPHLVKFKIPTYEDGYSWYRKVDTSLKTPNDFEENLSHKIEESYLLNPYSSILLVMPR